MSLYNFHRFDNLRHSERKTDPRRRPAAAAAAASTGDNDGRQAEKSNGDEVLRAAMANDVATLRRHQLQGTDMNYRLEEILIREHLGNLEQVIEENVGWPMGKQIP